VLVGVDAFVFTADVCDSELAVEVATAVFADVCEATLTADFEAALVAVESATADPVVTDVEFAPLTLSFVAKSVLLSA